MNRAWALTQHLHTISLDLLNYLKLQSRIVKDIDQEKARQENLEGILASPARLKIIVAGPGTGKSYTFGQIASRVGGHVVALTFLNNLANDLQTALGDSAEAQTLHGYARSLLHHNSFAGLSAEFDYYPPLEILLSEDLKCLGFDTCRRTLEGAFMNLEEDDGTVVAAILRGDYYDAVGHTDGVYRVYRALRDREFTVPIYAQLLVDEYQDFSRLEARLIDELATASPTLIVGDDDQALYSFRYASPVYIRQIVAGGEYERFELPYCTRCTSVLVEATRRVVAEARKVGLLRGRVEKTYECYMPDKATDSKVFPKIVHAHCSVENTKSPYMSRYIAKQIAELSTEEIAANAEKGEPTVLVVGQKHFLDRLQDELTAAGRTDFDRRSGSEPHVDAIDGYKLLANDERSRLGWRILLHLDRPDTWCKSVEKSNRGYELADLVPVEFRGSHLEMTGVVRKILQGVELTDAEKAKLETQLARSFEEVQTKLMHENDDVQPPANILLRSLFGSKGLQADYVFIVGVNERNFPKSNQQVTELEVCQLLVALTRAKKQCTIVSCNRFGGEQLGKSIFIDWLKPLLQEIWVDKLYWT